MHSRLDSSSASCSHPHSQWCHTPRTKTRQYLARHDDEPRKQCVVWQSFERRKCLESGRPTHSLSACPLSAHQKPRGPSSPSRRLASVLAYLISIVDLALVVSMEKEHSCTECRPLHDMLHLVRPTFGIRNMQKLEHSNRPYKLQRCRTCDEQPDVMATCTFNRQSVRVRDTCQSFSSVYLDRCVAMMVAGVQHSVADAVEPILYKSSCCQTTKSTSACGL